MNALPLMVQAASMFCARLRAEPDCVTLPTPVMDYPAGQPAVDLRWENVLLRSRTFRRAHVETFCVPDRLSVLHVCVFPHLDDPSPIYGFDMVAGPARVTGIFLDLSPVTSQSVSPRLADVVGAEALSGFAMPRTLPDWGDIFSGDMLAVRPISLDEVVRALGMAQMTLDAALPAPRISQVMPASNIALGQNRYIAGQRRNDHTFRMLSGFIGPNAARRFIDEVLFPQDNTATSDASPAEPPATASPGRQLERA